MLPQTTNPCRKLGVTTKTTRYSRRLLCAAWLASTSMISVASHAQIIQSFQKVSALQGGLTEAGVVLETRDDFGESLDAIGDLDGDGVIDLVVGTQRDDDGGTNRGAVYILFMNSDGTVDRSQKISDTEGGFTGELDDNDVFGISASSLGDVDGDGVLDIAVGAVGDDDGGNSAGAIYILFLNTDGTVKSHQKFSEVEGGFVGNTSRLGDDLERLNDQDGDGVPDLFVAQGGGSFWLVNLNADGTVKQNRQFSGTGLFGSTGALLGDLDGDGVDDIASGDSADDDGGPNRGAVWISLMNPDGTEKQRLKISNLVGGFDGLLEDGDQFGQSVSPMGDLNRDGIPDLLVGAENADSPDGSQSNSGELWLLFLNRDGTVQSSELITSGSENFIDVRRNSNLGQAVTFPGDLNGDGFGDIIGSADGDIDGAGVSTGAFYVFFLNPFNPPPASARFEQSTDSGNLLSIEAENFSANIVQGSHRWIPINNNEASNTTMMEATPNTGVNIQTDYAQTSPRLDYEVNFVTAGTHYVWVRGLGISGTDDSMHLGLDGVELLSTRRIDGFANNILEWSNEIRTNQLVLATMEVPTAGVHTLNAWMREDGFQFDKVLLTTDPDFVPTGFGPAESTSIASGNEAPVITQPADQSSLLNAFLSLQVEASDADAGDSLSYAANGLPNGLTLDPSSGIISGFPTTVGEFAVQLSVTDSNDFIAVSTFGWTITSDNQTPVLASIGDQVVDALQSLSFTITADDDGPGPLVLEAIGLPAGASFIDAGDGAGSFNWIPTLSDVPNSPFSVTFRAVDDNGNGLAAAQSIDVFVLDPNVDGSNRFQQSAGAGNLLVVEAENFSANVAQGQHAWETASAGAAAGSVAMDATPEIRTNNATNYALASPRLDFDVTFVSAGTHYVWVRGFSANTGADSVHVGLDGVDVLSSRRVDGFALQTFDWSGDVQVSPGVLQRATIEVATAGDRTLNIWMREDGFRVDRMLLTTDPDFVPSGVGPSESVRGLGSGGGNNVPSITSPGDQSTTLNGLVSLQIEATDIDGDGLTYSATGLPTGLSIDPTTGLIGGVVSNEADFSVIVTVADGNGGSSSLGFAWSVTAGNEVPRFQQSSAAGNFLVVEAENFSANTAQGLHNWAQRNGGGASGNRSMLASPNTGTNNSTNYAANSPRLDHEVSFVTAGTHYVWVRGLGRNLGGDSVHIGLDGVDLLSARRVDDFELNTFDWSGDIQVAPGQLQRTTIDVVTPGSHTLNVWMREDGFQVDKLLLTTDPDFVPTGVGPDESPR